MASYDAIRQRLPLLYRPEADDAGLLADFLQSVAALLDEVKREASFVLQNHWFDYADDARFNHFFRLQHQRAELPQPLPDSLEVQNFNVVRDLARICALLQLPPWRESVERREAVYHYRKRVQEIVAIYQRGLATLPALRAMIAAQLPDDSPDGLIRELNFSIEEYTGAAAQTTAIKARGFPTDKLGPLMHWTLDNPSLSEIIPQVFIEGLATDEQHDATIDPMIELFSDVRRQRIALAYSGTIEPGQTLRLTPLYDSWLADATGLHQARSDVAAVLPDPSAAGPWNTIDTDVAGTVNTLLQTRDHRLWVVINSSELLSFDGISWQTQLSGLPSVHCLAERDEQLLIGTAQGLLSVPLYPSDDVLVPQPDPASLSGPALFHLYETRNGDWWAATASGVKTLDADNQLQDTLLGADAASQIEVFHIDESVTGTLNFATSLGAVQYQPSYDHWYWFKGGQFSDAVADWVRYEGGAPAAADEIFLPPLSVCKRSADGSLWLGSEQGLARYYAREVSNNTFFTQLQFFPQLNCGSVTAIAEDASGHLWFASERGMLRFDGRHWYQIQDNQLQRVLGADDVIGEDQIWRFVRADNEWQWFDHAAGEWRTTAEDAGVVNEQPAAAQIIWTTAVEAALGAWDSATSTFNVDEGAVPGDLSMRYKPAADGERRIVNGGIPALPALPPGRSSWRYLRREDANAEASANRPHWTSEGRLLPPPDDSEVVQEGRFSALLQPFSGFNQAAFAYKPAARVWFRWSGTQPFHLLVRIMADSDWVDPAVLDRVWSGIQQVRPAGVKVKLALNNDIVRGN